MRTGFSNEIYLEKQTKKILERVGKFEKLYLEFGGKLLGDMHASRVLPGYDPNIKFALFEELRDKLEVVIAIRGRDIETNKMNNNTAMTYERECMKLINSLQEKNIMVNSVVINRYYNHKNLDGFIRKLNSYGIRTYKHDETAGFPHDIDTILSDEGFGKHSYIETTRPIVVVTAPGPGSGKMSTCLSQLYLENQKGIKAGYAKFETFPIWNLPLKHEINMAYEAATADLSDVNQIDPYHLEAYGKIAVNYNRDIENFPILKRMLDRIMGEDAYKSPTDMGVNCISDGIIDDEVCREAARQEIIRRYLNAQFNYKKYMLNGDELMRIHRLMDELGLKDTDRISLRHARDRKEKLYKEENQTRNITAIELDDGRVVTGKESELMDSAAAAVLNTLKLISGLPDELHMIDPAILNPILEMKRGIEKRNNTQLNLEEVLISLATSQLYNPSAKVSIGNIDKLSGLRGHSTSILPSIDYELFRKFNLDLTSDYYE